MKTGKERQQQKSNRISVDRSQWSVSSQRTYALMEFYEDITWSCRGCGQLIVFTAQEQQQAFEQQHVYIYWRPVLCAACAEKKQFTADSLQQHEARWRVNKHELQYDIPFLRRWLELLETYGGLSGRKNTTVIQMLQKLIRAQR